MLLLRSLQLAYVGRVTPLQQMLTKAAGSGAQGLAYYCKNLSESALQYFTQHRLTCPVQSVIITLARAIVRLL